MQIDSYVPVTLILHDVYGAIGSCCGWIFEIIESGNTQTNNSWFESVTQHPLCR